MLTQINEEQRLIYSPGVCIPQEVIDEPVNVNWIVMFGLTK